MNKQYPHLGEYPVEVDDVVLACYEAVIDPENEERCLKQERYAELSVNDLDTKPYWYHAHDEDCDEADEPTWWIPMPLPYMARDGVSVDDIAVFEDWHIMQNDVHAEILIKES